jgi:hypothetical protein
MLEFDESFNNEASEMKDDQLKRCKFLNIIF